MKPTTEKESILVETIRLLTTEERKELRFFVESPFFTRHVKNHREENLLLLFEEVCDCLQKGHRFEKAKAWQAIYHSQPYAEGTITSLMSNLLKLVHDYIHWKVSGMEDPVRQQYSLAVFFRRQGWHSRFEHFYHAASQALEQARLPDKEYYFQKFQLEHELKKALSLHNERNGDINIIAELKSLDWYYILQKLEITVHLLSQKRMVDFDAVEILQMEAINHRILEIPINERPALVRLLQLAIKIAAEKDIDSIELETYRQSLIAHDDHLSASLRLDLNAILRNYYSAMFNKTRDFGFVETLFIIYKEQAGQGLLLVDGRLPSSILQNLTLAGLMTKNIEWLKNFLEARPFPITQTDKSDAFYDYNLAHVYFALGDFKRAEALLNQNFTESYYKMFGDTYYVLQAHRLEIKIWYETNADPDFLLDKLKAFRIKVVRWSEKTLPAQRKELNLQFIRMVTDLVGLRRSMALRQKGLSEKIEAMRKAVSASQSAGREWVLEKLDALAEHAKGNS